MNALRHLRDRLRRRTGAPAPAWLAASAAALALAALGALAAVIAAAHAYATCGGAGCPDVSRLEALRPGQAPLLLDRDGRPFARLRPEGQGLATLAELPPYVAQAFVAVEDRRFFSHHGVDWRRVAGAAWANLRAGRLEEGSSTLTMQLARNAFRERLSARERSFERKLGEVRVARAIEARFAKRDILELYLNEISFGGGARGIEAAAHRYFDRPAAGLDLPQAALLAALPKAPSDYDPRRHPGRALDRRNLVLALMAAQGRIASDAAEAARRAPLEVVPDPGPATARPPAAPYFVQEVRRELEERFGDRLYDRPVRIFTTLDRRLQDAAEEALAHQLRAVESGRRGAFHGPRHSASATVDEDGTPYLQGAVIVLEPASGDVLAWVGGRDFSQSRFDRVRLGRRQLGSAFKPFVYAAALAEGHSPSELVSDQPLTVDLGHGEVWQPENFGHRYEGAITLRQALVQSKNVATVRLARAVGVGDVAYLARLAGFDAELPREPSLALGAAAVSPFEVARAYTPFATLGARVEPRLVRRIESADGRVLWRSPPDRERLLDPGLAYLVTDMLRDVVDRGTGFRVRQAGFRGPAAGKTGTTNDGRDAWFVGYTPRAVGVVWIGFDQPRRILPRATGGLLAAPVWGRMMRAGTAGGEADWPRPTDVVEYRVDPASGRVLAPGCEPLVGEAERDVFLAGLTPAASCPRWPDSEPGEALPVEASFRFSSPPDLPAASSFSEPAWDRPSTGDEDSRIEIEWHDPPPAPLPGSPAGPPRR